MKKVFCALLLVTGLLNAGIVPEFAYGNAARAAQQGDWQQSQERLTDLIIDAPDRADLLYDAGVAAYRLGQHEKAAAYFSSVTQKDDAPSELKKQAYFNQGNAQVGLKQYPEAITAYQAVLAIEPNNEPARHNLDKVRQLMAQQENKENKQDKNNDQNNDQNQQQQDQQSSEQKGQNNKNQKEQGSQNQDQKSGNDKEQSAGEKDKKEGSQQQKKGNEKDNSDQKADQQKGTDKNDQLGDNHDSSSSSKGADSQPTKKDAKEQEIQAGAIDDGEKERKQDDHAQLLDQLGADKKWMASILERQEKADEKAQKRLVKATVDKALAGEYGQNCW